MAAIEATKTRKIIGLVLSVAMIAAGTFVLYEWLTDDSLHLRKIWLSGPFLIGMGTIWIYSDWFER